MSVAALPPSPERSSFRAVPVVVLIVASVVPLTVKPPGVSLTLAACTAAMALVWLALAREVSAPCGASVSGVPVPVVAVAPPNSELTAVLDRAWLFWSVKVKPPLPSARTLIDVIAAAAVPVFA